MIGVVYFINLDSEKGIAEFGLYANPLEPLKRKGSILQMTVICYAFDFLNLNLLKLEVFEGNEKAIELYEKNNFQYVNAGYYNGRIVLYMELKKVKR